MNAPAVQRSSTKLVNDHNKILITIVVKPRQRMSTIEHNEPAA